MLHDADIFLPMIINYTTYVYIYIYIGHYKVHSSTSRNMLRSSVVGQPNNVLDSRDGEQEAAGECEGY